MNDWHSDDDKLYLRIQDNKAIFIDTGRISFVCLLGSLSLSDLGDSWFLSCSAPDVAMELVTYKETLAISAFLGILIFKE
jgi:hypothetical protein